MARIEQNKIGNWLAESSAFREGRVKPYVGGLERATVLMERLVVSGLRNGTVMGIAPELIRGAGKVLELYKGSPDRIVMTLAAGAMEAMEAVSGGSRLLQRMAKGMRHGQGGGYAKDLLGVLKAENRELRWWEMLGFRGKRQDWLATRDLMLGKDGEWGKKVGPVLLAPYIMGLELIVLAERLGETGQLLTRISLQSLETAVAAARLLNPRMVKEDVELVRSMSETAEILRGRIEVGVDPSPISKLGQGGFGKADPDKLSTTVSDVVTMVDSEVSRLAQVVERRQRGVERLRAQMSQANAAMMGTTAGIAAASGAETADTISMICDQVGTDVWTNLVLRQVMAAAFAARVAVEFLLSGDIGGEAGVKLEREANGQFERLNRLEKGIRMDRGVIDGKFRDE
jgi:hypothetical protein